MEAALFPPRLRVAASTISAWVRGKACPRDTLVLTPALDHLECLAADRCGKPSAARLRAACDEAHAQADAARRPPVTEQYSNAGMSGAATAVVDIVQATVPLVQSVGGQVLLGVVGNAVYARIESIVRRRREPAAFDEQDASLVARAAVQMRCHDLGITQPALDSPDNYGYRAADGRWLFYYRDVRSGQQFYVRLRPGGELSVDVVMPARPLGPRAEWEEMDRLGRQVLWPRRDLS